MATRIEHLNWSKERAREYVTQGDLPGAVASMISDLKKHDDFDGMLVATLGMIGIMDAQRGDANAVRRWIDGWN